MTFQRERAVIVVRFGRIDSRAIAALAQLPEVDQRVRLVAKRVDAEASRLAPRRSGKLASEPGIVVEETKDDDGALECHVTWSQAAFYGRFQEFGTSRSRAQPHLRPAAIKVRGS